MGIWALKLNSDAVDVEATGAALRVILADGRDDPRWRELDIIIDYLQVSMSVRGGLRSTPPA
jgi:hypothetical protein